MDYNNHMKSHHIQLKQVVLFGLVGLTTLAIDVVVATGLYNLLHFPAYLASAIGFLSGFAFNFPVNRNKVFNHSSSDKFSLRQQAVMYALLCVANLIITSVMVEVLVSLDMLSIQYAKTIMTALIAVWNFILFKFVIFSKNSGKHAL